MRKRTLMVIIFLFALIATNARSILDSAGKSVDELIDESNGIFRQDSGIPASPQESRDIWNRTSGVNFTMPGKLSGTGTTPGESRSAVSAGDSIQYQTASTESTAQTTPEKVAASTSTSSSAANAAGSWTFDLRDSKIRVLALTLFQSEDAIFGEGSMNDGTDTLQVLASGSVAGDRMSLDVTSSRTNSLYRLDLTTTGGMASGEYRAFSTTGAPWKGIAKGIRT